MFRWMSFTRGNTSENSPWWITLRDRPQWWREMTSESPVSIFLSSKLCHILLSITLLGKANKIKIFLFWKWKIQFFLLYILKILILFLKFFQVLDALAFERLLGPCMGIMKRNERELQEMMRRTFGSKVHIDCQNSANTTIKPSDGALNINYRPLTSEIGKQEKWLSIGIELVK